MTKEDNKIKFTVRLEPKTKDQLELMAVVKRMSLNEFITQLIYNEFRKENVQNEIDQFYSSLKEWFFTFFL